MRFRSDIYRPYRSCRATRFQRYYNLLAALKQAWRFGRLRLGGWLTLAVTGRRWLLWHKISAQFLSNVQNALHGGNAARPSDKRHPGVDGGQYGFFVQWNLAGHRVLECLFDVGS